MHKWETSNGTTVFRVSSGRSNAYLISTGRENILVDTGWRFSYDGLKRNIGFLNLSQPITQLVLTHTHFDHCYNASMIRQRERCNILISENDVTFGNNGYTPIPRGTIPVTRLLSRLGKAIGKIWFGYPPFIPDQIIGEDIDLQTVTSDIQIISTPGHSMGSISIIIDNEIAIVGDTMIGIFGNTIFPSFADDTGELIKSWRKLLDTECQLFLPGHGREIGRDLLQRDYESYLKKYNAQ